MVRRVKTLLEKFETRQPYQNSFYQPQENIELSSFPVNEEEKRLKESQNKIDNFREKKLRNLRQILEISEDEFSEEDVGFSKIANQTFEKELRDNKLIVIENRKKYFSEKRPMKKTRNIQSNSELNNILPTRLSGGRDPGWSSSTISIISEIEFQKSKNVIKKNWKNIRNKKTEIERYNARKRKLDPEIKYQKAIIPKYKFGLPTQYLRKDQLRISVSDNDLAVSDFQKVIKERKELSKSSPPQRKQSEILKSLKMGTYYWKKKI